MGEPRRTPAGVHMDSHIVIWLLDSKRNPWEKIPAVIGETRADTRPQQSPSFVMPTSSKLYHSSTHTFALRFSQRVHGVHARVPIHPSIIGWNHQAARFQPVFLTIISHRENISKERLTKVRLMAASSLAQMVRVAQHCFSFPAFVVVAVAARSTPPFLHSLLPMCIPLLPS